MKKILPKTDEVNLKSSRPKRTDLGHFLVFSFSYTDPPTFSITKISVKNAGIFHFVLAQVETLMKISSMHVVESWT